MIHNRLLPSAGMFVVLRVDIVSSNYYPIGEKEVATKEAAVQRAFELNEEVSPATNRPRTYPSDVYVAVDEHGAVLGGIPDSYVRNSRSRRPLLAA